MAEANKERGKYEVVIGLEVHVQLGTESKAFCSAPSGYGQEPNTQIDPVVLGLPGALPVFNRKALDYAIKLGVATHCEIRSVSRFSRKQYFYADLPKGYQISQFDEPLCEHGHVSFYLDGQLKKVRLTRIHIEEDAGKSTHRGAFSFVDLNRSGVPLCEVVSEPDIRSAAEAAEYMRSLRKVVRAIGVSEGNMEQGHLRCDANVSLRPWGQQEYGTRSELKNINSFRFVEKAILHEVSRQSAILDEGGSIVQETRLWDADAGRSYSMRSKEEADDYRYFPDPDLPPLIVDQARVEEIRRQLPELPTDRCQRYHEELGLPLEDAETLSTDGALGDYFDAGLKEYGGDAKSVANWVLSELLRELKRDEGDLEDAIASCKLTPRGLAGLLTRIDDNTISGKIAKGLLGDMISSGKTADALIEEKGLKQITDTGAIEAIAREVVEANPAQAQKYREGQSKMLGYFVGQVMKASGGKANPKAANQILRKLLDN